MNATVELRTIDVACPHCKAEAGAPCEFPSIEMAFVHGVVIGQYHMSRTTERDIARENGALPDRPIECESRAVDATPLDNSNVKCDL